MGYAKIPRQPFPANLVRILLRETLELFPRSPKSIVLLRELSPEFSCKIEGIGRRYLGKYCCHLSGVYGLVHSRKALRQHALRKNGHNLIAQIFVVAGRGQEFLSGPLI